MNAQKAKDDALLCRDVAKRNAILKEIVEKYPNSEEAEWAKTQLLRAEHRSNTEANPTMEEIKKILLSRLGQLFIYFLSGVLTLAFSYSPSQSGSLYGDPWSSGAEINPFLFAIGLGLLLAAWITYQKWKVESTKKVEKKIARNDF